jgi:hypothetical protein
LFPVVELSIWYGICCTISIRWLDFAWRQGDGRWIDDISCLIIYHVLQGPTLLRQQDGNRLALGEGQRPNATRSTTYQDIVQNDTRILEGRALHSKPTRNRVCAGKGLEVVASRFYFIFGSGNNIEFGGVQYFETTK